MPDSFIILFVAVVGIIALIVGIRAHVTRSREGKMLAFVALLVLPAAAVWAGFTEQMDRAQSRQFCLSCHVMEGYGRSLYIDDPSFIPAQHFQNNRVPEDRACYVCHSNYTMFGTVTAKMHGLRHLAVQYLGTVPKPEEIKLYEPFNNRECLHCHLGARKFEEAAPHRKDASLLPSVKANQKSCLSSGCHEFVHDVGSLKDATFWKPTEAK